MSSQTSLSFQYCKEFFSRCVTCPVYHQWVSELKTFIMRYGQRESMSSTNIARPFDTCLTTIWIEGEFLEENNFFGRNLGMQSKHSFLEPLSQRCCKQARILTDCQRPLQRRETQSYKDLVLALQIIIILSLALDPAQTDSGLLSLNSMTPSLSPLFQHL